MPPHDQNHSGSLYSPTGTGVGEWTLSSIVGLLVPWTLREDIRSNLPWAAQCVFEAGGIALHDLVDLLSSVYIPEQLFVRASQSITALCSRAREVGEGTASPAPPPPPNWHYVSVPEPVQAIKEVAIFLDTAYGIPSPLLDYLLFIADVMEVEYRDAIPAIPSTGRPGSLGGPSRDTGRPAMARARNEDDIFGADTHPGYATAGPLRREHQGGSSAVPLRESGAAPGRYTSFGPRTEQQTIDETYTPPQHLRHNSTSEPNANNFDQSGPSRWRNATDHFSSFRSWDCYGPPPYTSRQPNSTALLPGAGLNLRRGGDSGTFDYHDRRENDLSSMVDALRTRIEHLEASNPSAADLPDSSARQEPQPAELSGESSTRNAEKRWAMYKKKTSDTDTKHDEQEGSAALTSKGKGKSVAATTTEHENRASSVASDDTYLILTPTQSSTETEVTIRDSKPRVHGQVGTIGF